ncbi:sensor histidine kinase [Microlunatus antarcticus]|uniref:histidine kinase n=1 Tax=Microlunatus antarcticus TaxID=53388 RepID=A0A7W5JZE6_9ACTN|nr:HAMP domain-containing sensor histidine kinase [Microlunatus antarcticus]MBB3329129.1 two-component system OmpR family sensor kinase [Microlunatus antarcticus]
MVALAAVLLSAATFLATRQLLVREVGRQLDSVTSRVRYPDSNSGGPGRGPDTTLLRPGQPVGTFAVIYNGDGSLNDSGRLVESRANNSSSFNVDRLSTSAVDRLRVVKTDGTETTTAVPGLGQYLVSGFEVRDTSGALLQTIVVGLPLEEVNHQLIQLIGLEAVLAALAVAGAIVASRTVVRRSLRPLNRVAATAQQVSQLPLDRGEVALAVRVPPEDADPTSEVGRVGQAFNHMLNNVEDALAARQASETKVRQFVADASHELRNPLAAIRGYAELTRRERDSMSPNAAFAMSRVESEAERMSYLVEDLLLLARLDSGPNLDVAPVDLSEVVINALSDARAAGPDHVWQLDLPPEPVVALGDRYRLHQVVANLLANARTHTPPGTRVRAAVVLDGTNAVVTVTDTGPGIPDEIQSRVFERFTRAEVSRVRTPGAETGRSTGLGLAIVAAVVEAHHGTVTVDSQPGHTEFVVSLPLATPTGPAFGRPSTAGVA